MSGDSDVLRDIVRALPEHKISLTISHNVHRSLYRSLADYIDDLELDDNDWATPTSRERALKSDEIWEMQWYPETPIGFNWIAGATLEEVLEAGAIHARHTNTMPTESDSEGTFEVEES